MIQLSIIVPVYNVEKYVEQCIRSLYNQDIPQKDYEVICVDDCTPDGSCAIIERLQKEYPTLKLLHNERNKKLGGARNTGLKAAQGKYILFVDSDDYLISNCLSRLVREMDLTMLDFIHFDACATTDGLKYEEKHSSYSDSDIMSGPDMYFSDTQPTNTQVVAWDKIYRSDFIFRNNLFFVEDIMYEDNDYAMRVSAAAKRCKHIHFAPYVYRINNESITHSKIGMNNLLYWQVTWKQLLRIWPDLTKADARYDKCVKHYLQYDLYDLLNNLKGISATDKSVVKKALTLKEWYQVIRLLPIRKRLTYIVQLITA